MSAARTARRDRVLLALILVLGMLACTSRWRAQGNDTPPQDWWDERGPVVAHDTFPSDCSLCHAGGDWHTIRDDFVYDHGAETGVELVGAHTRAECLRCHNDRGPVAVFAGRGCRGCHEDVHRGQLGADCAVCHDESGPDWRPENSIAEHNRTRFQLVGAHAAAPCWRCHAGAQVGNFTTASIECVSCHAADLARATSPNHAALGYTDRCDRCHIPTGWSGADFTHSTWPLTGAHAAAACTACHVGGVFAGTPRDCFSCHANEYNNTTDPDHTAAGFPTSCENCHNTTTWFGATFDHRFPITSGPHQLDCTDCHLTPGSTAFSCTHCHAHTESRMADKHSGVRNYVWESGACLSCHPNGRH